MNSLSLKLCFPTSHFLILHQIRRGFSSANDKAATKKYLNFVNKSLYGAVATKKSKSHVEDGPPQPPLVDGKKEKTGQINKYVEMKSEMYWLLEHKPANPLVRKRISARPPDKQIPALHIQDAAKAKDYKEPIKPAKAVSKKLRRTKRNANSPMSLVKFKDSLCKTPLRQASQQILTKLGSNNDRLKEIFNVPPFDLSNWSPSNNSITVGNDQIEVRQMPSVSKVLQATMSESARKALMQWKLLKIAELGEQGFQELQQAHFTAGSNFHAAIQNFFHTKSVPDLRSPEAKIWSSVESVIAGIDSNAELVESPIVHPVLQYKGIVDCVSRVDGQISVIEWKKSDRLKASISATYDAPLQLCAYLGAINADPRYSLEVRNGLVVVAYPSGVPANAFVMDEKNVQKYWRMWLKRLHEYWVRHRDGTLPEPI